jgi:SAM-dependent methyltransferase
MEWFEDDRFWELTYPFMFPDDRMERAEEQADALLYLAGINRGEVLDLCCGPGRYSMAMARRGFAVTGVDRTSMLLDTARSLAAIQGLDIEWVQSDMRDFIRPGSFDLALSMFTSFGYFESHDDNLKVLRNLHDSLRPGGRLLLETMGKEILASIFRPVTTEELEDGSLLIERHTIEHGWKRISNDWLIIREDALEGRFRFSHWIYSAVEIEEMMIAAGFDFVAVHGDLDGSPYNDQARRLVIVAARGE